MQIKIFDAQFNISDLCLITNLNVLHPHLLIEILHANTSGKNNA